MVGGVVSRLLVRLIDIASLLVAIIKTSDSLQTASGEAPDGGVHPFSDKRDDLLSILH